MISRHRLSDDFTPWKIFPFYGTFWGLRVMVHETFDDVGADVGAGKFW